MGVHIEEWGNHEVEEMLANGSIRVHVKGYIRE